MPSFARLLPTLALAMPTLLACSNSQAGPKAGDQFGDWIYECQAVAEDKANCNLAQTIITKKDNRRLLKLSIANPAQGNAGPLLSVLLPLGVHLPSGVNATVVSAKDSSGKPFALTLQTCIQQGCIASTRLDSAQLTALRGGAQLAISFAANGAGKPLTVQGSLKGITEGLQALNVK